MKTKFSKFIWGAFLLLAAAFILLNQFSSFRNIGIRSIIIATLSIIFLIQCIADLHFAAIPVPLAVLYIVFQAPLGLPYIRFWILIFASILASAGLAILLPKKYQHKAAFKTTNCNQPGDQPRIQTQYGDNDNNPSINVNFGGVSRHLCANSLETAQLNCSFGAMEIFFDQVELSPNGAEAILDCSFGAIKLYIPRHWRLIVQINCTLGGVDTDKNFATLEANAPQLTLTGRVSLGGVEVRRL